jgi:hypothetical protein
VSRRCAADGEALQKSEGMQSTFVRLVRPCSSGLAVSVAVKNNC